MTLFWLLLLPVIFNSLFKYLFTLVIPLLQFSLVYLFYIPVISVVFLSSIHYMFFTVWVSQWVITSPFSFSLLLSLSCSPRATIMWFLVRVRKKRTTWKSNVSRDACHFRLSVYIRVTWCKLTHVPSEVHLTGTRKIHLNQATLQVGTHVTS